MPRRSARFAAAASTRRGKPALRRGMRRRHSGKLQPSSNALGASSANASIAHATLDGLCELLGGGQRLLHAH